MTWNKKLYSILEILCMAIFIALPLTGCQSDTEDKVSRIAYHYADKEEGTRLLLVNAEYQNGLSVNDLQFRLLKEDVSLDEYLAFLKEQVSEFSEEQKAAIDGLMAKINEHIEKEQYHLPLSEEITLVMTSMREEPGADAYTHKTDIYMNMVLPALAGSPDALYQTKAFEIMCHEIFHTLTRNNPEFRKAMYEIIHFKIADHDFELPPSAKEYYLSNPDVGHHDAYASFEIRGEAIDCYVVLNSRKHFENPTDVMLEVAKPVLVPIDGTDIVYEKWQADNFDEIFGKNTDYVIDPEECMANNFAFAMTYGMDGPDGKGYANPEIIEAIIRYLKGE